MLIPEKYRRPIMLVVVIFALVTFSISGPVMAFFGNIGQRPRGTIEVGDGRVVELTQEDMKYGRLLFQRKAWPTLSLVFGFLCTLLSFDLGLLFHDTLKLFVACQCLLLRIYGLVLRPGCDPRRAKQQYHEYERSKDGAAVLDPGQDFRPRYRQSNRHASVLPLASEPP